MNQKNLLNKNERGITLIALVITIIVLLILAGVAISMLSGENGILNQAATAKTETEKKSTEEAVKLAAMSALTVGEGNFKSQKALDVLNDELDKAGYEGDPITQDSFEGETGVTITIGEEEYTISANGVVTDNSNVTKEYTAYSIGDEVTIEGESFYVIKDSDATQEKVTLLAKHNLKADGSAQDTTGASNPCAFSSTNYWSSEESYPADLNDTVKYPIPEGATSIVTIAKSYGESLGATGRLMTVEEVEALGGSRNDYSTSGCTGEKAFINEVDGKKLNYWLGSAYDDDFVWIVYGEDSSLYYDFCSSADSYGVRPVIEILKSSIK